MEHLGMEIVDCKVDQWVLIGFTQYPSTKVPGSLVLEEGG